MRRIKFPLKHDKKDLQKNKMTKFSKILKAFKENDAIELKKLWSEQTFSEMVNFDFNALCDELGAYMQIWCLPQDSVNFFVTNCGSRFLTLLSAKFRMGNGGNEFEAYCEAFPQLIPLFEAHFDKKFEKKSSVSSSKILVAEFSSEKAEIVDDGSTTVEAIALKCIQTNIVNKNYDGAIDACKALQQYLESVAYFKK